MPFCMAEREGFEPSRGCYPSNGLANRPLEPLGHLSDCLTKARAASVASVAWAQRILLFSSFGRVGPRPSRAESHPATSPFKFNRPDRLSADPGQHLQPIKTSTAKKN